MDLQPSMKSLQTSRTNPDHTWSFETCISPNAARLPPYPGSHLAQKAEVSPPAVPTKSKFPRCTCRETPGATVASVARCL